MRRRSRISVEAAILPASILSLFFFDAAIAQSISAHHTSPGSLRLQPGLATTNVDRTTHCQHETTTGQVGTDELKEDAAAINVDGLSSDVLHHRKIESSFPHILRRLRTTHGDHHRHPTSESFVF